MKKELFCKVFAASCTYDGGISSYTLSEEGRLTFLSQIKLDRPMYFIKEQNDLHVLLRAPEGLDGMSGYVKISADLGRSEPQSPIPTNGVVACHLCKVGERIYATNYLSGSLSEVGGKVSVHPNDLEHPFGRQEAPHTHCVIPGAEKDQLFCTDLGLDSIFVYDVELNLLSRCRMPKGHGVRHLTAGKNGIYYAVNELAATVSVLQYEPTTKSLSCLSTVSCGDVCEGTLAAAIRLSKDGKHLYVSLRGEDKIAVFAVEENGYRLSLLRLIPCGGNGPRDIFLSPDDRFLISANEVSGDLTVLCLEGENAGRLTDRVPLAQALCVYCE